MKIELMFIPSPGIGHLKPTIKLAKQLIGVNERLSITVIIIPSRNEAVDATANIASLKTASQDPRLRYEAISSVVQSPTAVLESSQVYIEKQKAKVRETVARIVDPTRKLAGFVVDMFCCSMVDVANEFGVPSYMIYTSNAAFLGMTLHVQSLYDENKYDVKELLEEDSVNELEFPCLTRPYPVKCVPHCLTSNEWLPLFVEQGRSFRKMKGILVNTVAELEPHALKILSGSGDVPQAYPVGPVLHLENEKEEMQSEILQWLDEQPIKSVVFLCFGSLGGFTEEQTREIAEALDKSGHRFLWSLRRASPNIMKERPGDYTNLEEVLPEGFLNRTSDRGKVTGWAPQVAVLAKPAIGAFVTHCGWNSILESLWFGVPMVTWPLYAEQKVNAFVMVEELGLAVEIRKCIRGDLLAGQIETVTADDIERAIRCVMEQNSDVRSRAKEMAEKCHVALMDDGSSHKALQQFVHDVIENVD